MRRALAVLSLAAAASGCAAAPVVQAPAPPARDEMVVLLPGPDGTVGALTVEHEGQQRTLDAAYATTRLQRQGRLEDAGRTAPE
jgi:opacity protein-like surface antigen